MMRTVNMSPGGLEPGDTFRFDGGLYHVSRVRCVGPFSVDLDARDSRGKRVRMDVPLGETVQATLRCGECEDILQALDEATGGQHPLLLHDGAVAQ